MATAGPGSVQRKDETVVKRSSMPPFQYRTFQDPYVGDITRLMGAGPEAEARSIREVGNIRAQEAQQKGAIRSNLAQGLGQTVNQGYTAYREAKADEMFNVLTGQLTTKAQYESVGEDFPRPMDFSKMPKGPTREDIFSNRPIPDVGSEALPTPRVTHDDVPQTGAQWDQRYGGVSPAIDPGPSPEGQVGEIVDIPTPEATIPLPEAPVSPPAVPQDMTLEGTPDAAAPLGAIDGADIGTGEAPISPPVPPEVPPAVPGEPDTQTMAGLLEGLTGTSTLAEPRTSPFVHVLRDGQYNIQSLTAALADKGVARDQIDRLMGRATQYNASIKAMNEESRDYQIEESKIENANLFAQAVARHPDLGPELLTEAIAIYGTEGAKIYEGLMKGVRARQEIAEGKTEGLQENIHSIATMLEFAVHPAMQQQLSRALVQSIEDAGQPVLPEMYDFTPDQWRDLADSYGGERPTPIEPNVRINKAAENLERVRERYEPGSPEVMDASLEMMLAVELGYMSQIPDLPSEGYIWALAPGETRARRMTNATAIDIGATKVPSGGSESDTPELDLDVPSVIRNVVDRIAISMPSTRLPGLFRSVNRTYAENDLMELKDILRLAAIESEPVATKGEIMGRIGTIAALQDIREQLTELDATGYSTGPLVGGVEALARKLGNTTDARHVEIGNELADILVRYRRAATGVQFGYQEQAIYKDMFPDIGNELPVNLAQIDGLLNNMNRFDRVYWLSKVGPTGADYLGVLPSPPEPEGVIFDGPNGVVWIQRPDGTVEKLEGDR
jgi:hypothetical protein